MSGPLFRWDLVKALHLQLSGVTASLRAAIPTGLGGSKP